MQGYAITNFGMEDISANEINNILKTKTNSRQGLVLYEANEEEIIKVCYQARTIIKTGIKLAEFSFQSIEEILAAAEKIELTKCNTLVIQVERHGTHPFTSIDVEKTLIKTILEKTKAKYEYKNPEQTIFVFITDNQAIIGIEFSGIDLARRPYRIFLTAQSLRGNVAAGMLKIAEYNSEKTLIDPFCRDGIIPIEAALLGLNKSPHEFEQEKLAFNKLTNKKVPVTKSEEKKLKIHALDPNFKNISNTRKNAKIAGVIKNINYSRLDLEWLDTKFEKNTVDCIVTMPVQPSSIVNPKKIEKIYKELFHQANYILTQKGKIVLAVYRGADLLISNAQNFVPTHKREIKQGKEKITIIVFERLHH